MTVRGEKSLEWDISRVLIKLANLSAAKRSGLRSMQTFLAQSAKNPAGDSWKKGKIIKVMSLIVDKVCYSV